MNLRQLRYFCDAAQLENFAKVAEKYNVPSSAVSVAIKQLEAELGVALFDRSANKIKLNEKGRLLAEEVQQSFLRMETVRQQISQSKTMPTPIKVLIRARPKWITELITQFKAKNPQVSFIISNDYGVSDINGFDVVIDEDAKQYKKWERFLLSSEIICVKAASDNPLVNKTLTFADLKDQVFILPSVGNGMRNLYERTCKRLGLKPNVAIECNDRQCLQYYVQANMGLTLGAYRALSDDTQDHISPLKVIDFNETQLVYVFYQADNGNVYTKAFRDFLYDQRYL